MISTQYLTFPLLCGSSSCTQRYHAMASDGAPGSEFRKRSTVSHAGLSADAVQPQQSALPE